MTLDDFKTSLLGIGVGRYGDVRHEPIAGRGCGVSGWLAGNAYKKKRQCRSGYDVRRIMYLPNVHFFRLIEWFI